MPTFDELTLITSLQLLLLASWLQFEVNFCNSTIDDLNTMLDIGSVWPDVLLMFMLNVDWPPLGNDIDVVDGVIVNMGAAITGLTKVIYKQIAFKNFLDNVPICMFNLTSPRYDYLYRVTQHYKVTV
jgi:hypothetical protein